MVVEHAHSRLQVNKLYWIDLADLFVCGFLHEDKLMELLGGSVLCMSQDLGYTRQRKHIQIKSDTNLNFESKDQIQRDYSILAICYLI